MAKPNAVEEIMARSVARNALPDRLKGQNPPPIPDDYLVAQNHLAALEFAGLAIVPHDWNHREEDWSLESVSEWLDKSKEG